MNYISLYFTLFFSPNIWICSSTGTGPNYTKYGSLDNPESIYWALTRGTIPGRSSIAFQSPINSVILSLLPSILPTFLHSFIHPSIYLFIHSFIYSCIDLFILHSVVLSTSTSVCLDLCCSCTFLYSGIHNYSYQIIYTHLVGFGKRIFKTSSHWGIQCFIGVKTKG